jgi:ATP-dependent DNA helicase RecG
MAVVAELPDSVLEQLNKAERAGWEWLATRESVSAAEYAEALSVPRRTALNHLKHFAELNLTEKISSGPSTRYRVAR